MLRSPGKATGRFGGCEMIQVDGEVFEARERSQDREVLGIDFKALTEL